MKWHPYRSGRLGDLCACVERKMLSFDWLIFPTWERCSQVSCSRTERNVYKFASLKSSQFCSTSRLILSISVQAKVDKDSKTVAFTCVTLDLNPFNYPF